MSTPAKKTKDKRPVRAGFLIHDVSRLRRTVYDQRLKVLGFTRSQWWVFSNLSRHEGQGFMQVELARLLNVGKVTLGGLIDRLEERGFVVRVPDKIDRRSKRVKMSRKGVAMIHKLEAVAAVVNAEIMKSIPEEDEEALIRILRKMKHNLMEMEGALGAAGSHSESG